MIERKKMALIFLAYLLISSILYLNLPISEDESSIYFASEKWNEGYTPYKNYFGESKAPGMYYYVAPFLKFTHSIQLLRLSIFFVNIIAAFFVYLVCRNLFDKKKGILAAIIFLIINLFPGMFGYFFLNDRFLVLFSLISIYFFLRSNTNKYYVIASGILAGIATVFKQLGVTLPVLFIIFYFYMTLTKKKQFKDTIFDSMVLILGYMVPILLVVLHFFILGGLESMVYWTFTSVKSYLIHPEGILSLGHMYRFSVMAPFWIPALIVSIKFIIKFFKNSLLLKTKTHFMYQSNISDNELFLLLWLISTIPVMILVLDFQPVHFAPLSIMSAIFFLEMFTGRHSFAGRQSFNKPSSIKKTILYTLIVFIIILSASLNIYSEYNLQTTRYGFYKQEMDTAEYIKEHTETNETIYVFGYRPSIYILSGRDPPADVPVLANFNIQVKGKYENTTIKSLQEQHVRYVVHETITTPKDAPVIFDYIQKHYKMETTIGRFVIYSR